MAAESIADQHARLGASSNFGSGIEYTLQPLQTDFRIGEAWLRACIMPAGRGKRRLIAPMSRGWPDYYGIQIPNLTTDAFDGGDQCPFDSGTSIVTHTISANKDLHRTPAFTA